MSAAAIELTHEIYAKMEMMTPERAREIRARGDKNRPISRPHVRELRREIDEGRWLPTHQGVAFSPEGKLLDGQHRLDAIAEGEVAVPILVTYNVPENAFAVIDQHRKRTGGQILAMESATKDPTRVVAMARTILQVVHGNNKISNTQAAEFAMAHQTELELFLPVTRRFTPAVGAAFAWCATLGWEETIPAAERLVANGPWEEPQETDPMRALANRSREFGKLGAGAAGIKGRFDVALNCLQAVHEKRGLRVARSYRPDYGALERESMAAAADGVRHSVHAPKGGYTAGLEAAAQSIIEYERSLEHPSDPPVGSLAYEGPESIRVEGFSHLPPVDPEVAASVAEQAGRVTRRKRAE